MSEFPRAPVLRVMKNAGAQRISKDAAIAVHDATEDYCSNIASKASMYAEHAGRKTIKVSDVKLALK